MTRLALIGLFFTALAASAGERPLDFTGRGAAQVLAAARALTQARPVEGHWQIDGELLLQKRVGTLGGLPSTSYGFVLLAGGKADRIKYAPLELLDAVKENWPNRAPFEADNLWRVQPSFHVEAAVGDEANARLTLTFPKQRRLRVQCNSQDPHSGPFLFQAALAADEALEHASLAEVRVVNWLRTGAHFENGGQDLFPAGALDERDGNLHIAFHPQNKVMELGAEWKSGSRLAIAQDVDDKSDVYVGNLYLAGQAKQQFTVQCRVSRDY